ncbi:YTH domain-containing protein ECT3-like [Hevea brasiliensis]|uniref:YTH domain-containing protein ECT3-like n=1 Tax=Hevea brasiliensis TaxID=3981 RepID=UPI0025CBDD25|nr:YTH domain-containing protein ECT3-like [Hevea brasiliensis]
MPFYSWGSAYVSDVSNGNTGSRNGKYGSGSTLAKSSGFNSMKSNGNTAGKSSKSTNTQVSTLGSDFSAGLLKGYHPVGNLPPFSVQKHGAKFYVIKSYNEDDIHKSIKYDAWASTPNGNKKLDAAFREAEQRSGGTGTKCPILLFFFAEVVGQVDFDKDMDFWQLRKWNGFFPVKWHVEKDIPNSHLRHIILENNGRWPVTYSRDTQEIGLEQDLEMLNIFKSYSAKTSLSDDFNFYENQEKSLHTKKSNKPATLRMEIHENGDFL